MNRVGPVTRNLIQSGRLRERARKLRKIGGYGALKPLRQQKAFRSLVRSLHQQDWVVYAKPPFGGPRYVLNYLARYTHRVAISNHRLVAFADGKVTFRWKDYAHGNKRRLMTLTAEEFLRRFLQHVLLTRCKAEDRMDEG